ncbi:hypothetical protein AB4Z42_08805 [Mycobacterium sp. 2YAF39]|uniref:hypothetical protein n=1 Tax=Mycobacterium sp. 2YAF39 TaxID=3233033 RepID=UPI003F9D03FA
MLLKLKGILGIVGIHQTGGKPFTIVVWIAGSACGQPTPHAHGRGCVGANRGLNGAMARITTDEKHFTRAICDRRSRERPPSVAHINGLYSSVGGKDTFEQHKIPVDSVTRRGRQNAAESQNHPVSLNR